MRRNRIGSWLFRQPSFPARIVQNHLFYKLYPIEGIFSSKFLKNIKLFVSALDFVLFYVYDYIHRQTCSFYLFFVTIIDLGSIL